jgi:hypothetical protein
MVPMDSSQNVSLNSQPHDGDVVPLVSKDSRTAEEARSGEPTGDPDVRRDSSDQCIGMAREEFDVPARLPAVQPFPLVPQGLLTDQARSGGQAPDPDAGHNSPHQRIMARGGSDFSAELRPAAASIREPPRTPGLNDQFSSDRPSMGGRIIRSFARFFVGALIAALIGVAASSAWQSHGDKAKAMMVRTWAPSLGWLSSDWQSRGGEAKRMVRTWTSSLGWLLSVSTTKSSPDLDVAAKQPHPTPAGRVSVQDAALPQSAPVTQKPGPAAAAVSPELVQQLEAMARDVAVVRRRLEQLAAKQEQMAQNIATLQAVEQDTRQKMSSPPQSGAVPPHKNAPMLAPPQPQPPARVSILTDWSIRDARDGYLTVQGHGDVYQVVIDAPLPGIGPVEQIKRQGGRWVVVTPKGIIVSMRDRRYFEQRTAP